MTDREIVATLRERSAVACGCFIWQGATAAAGYGELEVDGKPEYVHRLAHRIFHGPIPKGRIVMHGCSAPACWAPDHLYAGTPRANQVHARLMGNVPLTREQMKQLDGFLELGLPKAKVQMFLRRWAKLMGAPPERIHRFSPKLSTT